MLDELEKLAREATAPPWKHEYETGMPVVSHKDGIHLIDLRDADAAYIAAIVNAAPLLLAAVRAAEARIEYGCSDTCATMMRGDADCSCGHKALDAALAALKGST